MLYLGVYTEDGRYFGWALFWMGVILEGRYFGRALLGAFTVLDRCVHQSGCSVLTKRSKKANA